MSTKPGATTQPSASIVSSALVSGAARPTCTMRPSRTATSAVYAGSPLPSTTVPPRISTSSSGTVRPLFVPSFDAVDASCVGAHELAPTVVRHRLDVFDELVDHTWILGIGVREVARPDQVVF